MKNQRLPFLRRGSIPGWGMVMAALSAVVCMAAPVGAEDLPDTFMLRLGGYHVRNADTIVRFDSNNLPVGTYINFEDTLGGDTSTTVARADGLFRFNESHGLGLSWYALRFTGSRVLNKDINWGGITYPIGARADSEIKFDIYKLNYQYSVYHNDKVELGALIGFHVLRAFAGITGNGTQSQSEAVTAPMPVLGLFANYNATPRFSVYYNYQFFFIDYEDKAKGGLQDFLFGMEYRLFKHFSLGAAYNRFGANLELKDDTRTLFFNTGWNGGLLYGALYF